MLKEMYGKVKTVAAAIVAMHRGFVNSARDLELKNLTYEDIRVPCDVRRKGVLAAEWIPHDVREGNIGSLEGLILGLTMARDLQRSRGVVLPVLSDVNIFYRGLKIMYGANFADQNVRGALNDVPMLFGVWHAYAHCVKRCYTVFKSFWACLEFRDMLRQPEDTVVYSYPKLVTLEHMVVAMLLARGEVRRRLEQCLQLSNADVLVCQRRWQLTMLQRLLFDFVPALMQLGISVRRCYWEGRRPNTGDWARQVLSDCLVFLVSVDSRGSSEYIQSLGLTLLYWSPFHSALPAVAFVEEALEASLSRLAKMTFSSYHADDVSGVGAMYSSLGPASSKKRDLVKPGVSRVFVRQLVIRLGKLLDHIVVGTMPHVATGKAHKVSGTRLWPAGRLALPPRVLMVDRDVTFYADVLVNAMHVMMKAGSPGAWDHELVAGLAAGAPRLSRKKLAARTEMVGFLDKKKRKWRKAAADARGSGKRRRHLGDVRSGEPIGMCHPCSFSPLATFPFHSATSGGACVGGASPWMCGASRRGAGG